MRLPRVFVVLGLVLAPPTAAEKAPAARWNLEAALEDQPKGAYLNLLRPVVRANLVTYWTSHGSRRTDTGIADNITEEWSGGGSWTRLTEVERSSQDLPRLRVFVDVERRQAILVLGGECIDFKIDGTLADICMMQAFMMGTSEQQDELPQCPVSAADYFQSAVEAVREAREALLKRHPEMALLLTGHSLGGALALSVQAVVDFDIQVVALEPAVFGPLLLLELTPNAARLAATADRVALFDPTNLLRIRGFFIKEMDLMFDDLDAKSPEAQYPGVTFCSFSRHPVPKSCADCSKRHRAQEASLSKSAAMERCALEKPSVEEQVGGRLMTQCQDDAQWLMRYARVFLPAPGSQAEPVLPSCHTVQAAKVPPRQADDSCSPGDEVCAARPRVTAAL